MFLFVLGTLPASAAAACYTPDEAEAEQGIRIHSELMVIGLNCQHMARAGKKNLYLEYRDFTARHAQVFSDYETRLIRYFRRSAWSPEAWGRHRPSIADQEAL